jgi:hypothetical protein
MEAGPRRRSPTTAADSSSWNAAARPPDSAAGNTCLGTRPSRQRRGPGGITLADVSEQALPPRGAWRASGRAVTPTPVHRQAISSASAPAIVCTSYTSRDGADGGQVGVPGGGADLAELVPDVPGCRGDFDGVGVAQVQQLPVGELGPAAASLLLERGLLRQRADRDHRPGRRDVPAARVARPEGGTVRPARRSRSARAEPPRSAWRTPGPRKTGRTCR